MKLNFEKDWKKLQNKVLLLAILLLWKVNRFLWKLNLGKPKFSSESSKPIQKFIL